MAFYSDYLLCRDRVGGLIFLLFSLIYGYQTTLIPLFPGDEYEAFTAQTLPFILTSAGALLSLLLICIAKPNEKNDDLIGLNWRLLLIFIVLMILYGIALTWLGFLLATSLFLLTGFWVLGERRKTVLFGASFPFVLAFWLLLTQVLGIYLEPGYLFSQF